MLGFLDDYFPKTTDTAASEAAGAGSISSPLKKLASKGYEAAMAALSPLATQGGGGGGGPGPSPAAQGLSGLAKALVEGGLRDENELTNELFYTEFPELRGMKLKGGTQEAREWLRLRDDVARPALAAAKSKPAGGGGGGGSAEKEPIPDTPIDAPEVGPSGPIGTSGRGDLYMTQNNNSYDDDISEWSKGSASHNTCNMTSLTMALISLAGSEERCRQAVLALLKKEGVRSGAKVKIGGKTMSLSQALGDSKCASKVQLDDLVIAAAVSITNDYSAVTSPNTIKKVALKTGLAKSGTAKSEKLYEPGILQKAKDLVASGQRIVVGTKGHYVYLTEVRDDGIVVHDPAGARVAVDSDKYLWPGAVGSKLGAWLNRLGNDDRRATLVRRMRTNSQARGVMEQVAAMAALKGDEKKQAKADLKATASGTVETGANNFYSLEDLKTYNCRIRVVLEGETA